MMKGAPKAGIFPGNTMVEENTKFENIMIESTMTHKKAFFLLSSFRESSFNNILPNFEM